MEPTPKKRGTRTGFTTGACSAAAAKAATRILVCGEVAVLGEPRSIATTLPNGDQVTFALERCEYDGRRATCSIIKDAGDDPDCTHGAELTATVELRRDPPIVLCGGSGVATVTKPGLGLVVGDPAINPVPRRNITEMVAEELVASECRGAIVTLSVPGGEEMAKQTLNARLGLLGGISILGTTGIVKPYSTAAYKASVVQAIDVAKERGLTTLVLTTGGKSEAYAMRLHPELAEEAFIQVGDFIGVAVKHTARRQLAQAVVVGMVGKLTKMAQGKMQTHAAGSAVDLELLAAFAEEVGAGPAIVAEIRGANTARHVLELCQRHGLMAVATLICRRVSEQCRQHAGGALPVAAELVDFEGTLIGAWPEDRRGRIP